MEKPRSRGFFFSGMEKAWPLLEVSVDSVLNDWCEFCNGRAEFDKSHFYGLIKDHPSPEELGVIFGFFPHAEILVKNTLEVISAGVLGPYLVSGPVAGREELLESASGWLRAMQHMAECVGDSEIGAICANATIEFVSGDVIDEVQKGDVPEYWFFDRVGDSLSEELISQSRFTSALLEALYGLAADYYLVWYIAAPLYDTKLEFRPYFEFWRDGGRSVLTDGVMYVREK